ncbi:hypothetical protein NDU88_006773 [Pleurodeles waltl]|uniref:Uncharacterized protein n=1 Tax=Pleurodeles waltl TaxID=8319 RepID=A0AAV7QIP9_PLEWA|nr:hypothetical protein NDU88_006773 [Pleurodeles waltl]
MPWMLLEPCPTVQAEPELQTAEEHSTHQDPVSAEESKRRHLPVSHDTRDAKKQQVAVRMDQKGCGGVGAVLFIRRQFL